ncbi:MAG TPA: hypothetical protein VMW70_15365 [Burkholderiales bacterium]|nr:hypothetical protein [Burkholderiales bacterium]
MIKAIRIMGGGAWGKDRYLKRLFIASLSGTCKDIGMGCHKSAGAPR